MSFKNFAIIVSTIVVLFAISISVASAGNGKTYYTCDKLFCGSYNSDGTKQFNSLYGVSYRAGVWNGSRIVASNLSNGWLKQSLFETQSSYYLAADFK